MLDLILASSSCPEPDLSNTCTTACHTTLATCADSCGTNANCIVDCNYASSMCVNDCPCMQNCPNGCEGCPNPICQCKDPEHEPDYLICKEYYEAVFLICSKECNNELDCVLECSRHLDIDLKKCPCQENCPGGCPCDEYECPVSTTPDPIVSTTAPFGQKSILTLNTYVGDHEPLLINTYGYGSTQFRFDVQATVYKSCSLVFQNRMFVLGGSGFSKRQIAEISGESCSIAPVDSGRVLPFNFEYGACTVVADTHAVLCFDENAYRVCYATRSAAFDDFDEIEQSNYYHRHTRIATSSSSQSILAVGSAMPSNTKVELLNFEKETWRVMPDYPDVDEIHHAPVVAVGDDFFVYGGSLGGNVATDRVMRLSNSEWTMLQLLFRHGVIQRDNYTWIIGGPFARPVEKCSYAFDTVYCEVADYAIENYVNYPELFLVDHDFCQY